MKRIVERFLGIALVVNATMVPLSAEEKTFQEFMDEQYVELMEGDYTTLHFGLRDYASMGIEKPDVSFGSVSWDDYESDLKDAQETLQELESYDYNALTDAEKVDYDVFHESLENTILLNQYPYFDWGFNPSNGVIDGLLTTCTEFVFYEKEDIDDYLTMLASADEYIDDVIEITQKQVDKGYFLNDMMVEEALDAIDKFVEKKNDNQLIVIFDKNVDAFTGLSDGEREAYKKKNRDIVLNEFIPSYEKAGAQIEAWKQSRTAGDRVCDLEDGKEYYASLARSKTSLNMSVEEMLDVCNEYLDRSIDEFYDLLMHGDEDAMEEELDFADADDVLQYLQNHLDDFPVGPEVTYTATYLDPSVANDSVVAYYMEPPVDDIKDNVIKINGDNISDKNELYSTLAHEGFPGHLFQITYYLNTNPSKLRTQLSAQGYTEGWGMYAEMMALDVSELNEDAKLYQKLNTGISYVMGAAIDLGVNGLGWSVEDTEDYLDDLGLNSEIAEDLYEFVVTRPGSILPYGVGLAEYENLRVDTMKSLGKKFDLKEFNTVLLEGGARPFARVEKDVESYVSSKGGKSKKTDTKKHTEKKDKTDNKATSSRNAGFIVAGVCVVLLGCIVLIRVLRKRRKQ